MCRSQKDGKKGGGHKKLKWQIARDRRMTRARRYSGQQLAAEEYESYLTALDVEMRHEFLDEWQEDTDCEWPMEDDWHEYEEVHFWDDPPSNPELQVYVFQAIDRAVYMHGVDLVSKNVSLVATLLDIPIHEVQYAAALTQKGYMR